MVLTFLMLRDARVWISHNRRLKARGSGYKEDGMPESDKEKEKKEQKDDL